MQPILFSPSNSTQYVMVFPLLPYVGHPAIAIESWGMGCRTYPKWQFRAGSIVDLGYTDEKALLTIISRTDASSHLPSLFTHLHRSRGLTRSHAMHQHTVAMINPLSPTPIIQSNQIERCSSHFLHHTPPFSTYPLIANF